jgi:hypothetical protein
MRFEKHVTIQAPRTVIWDCLWNIARLASCVPGCQTGSCVPTLRIMYRDLSRSVCAVRISRS